MLFDDSTVAQTFELYGPKNYSTSEISELVDREIIKKRRHINVPKAIMKPTAHYLNRLIWWPISSADEVEREFIDQKIDPSAKTFKDLNIEPAELSNLTFHYLVCIFFHLRAYTTLYIFAHYYPTERISEFAIPRSSTSNGAREKRRKEISPRYRWSVVILLYLRTCIYMCVWAMRDIEPSHRKLEG